jgi:outer membrane protein assembly factor BamB/tetratricopeptide (TPR) repeat protein
MSISWSSRRATLVLAAVAVLGAASVVQHVYAQRVKVVPVVPGGPAPGGPGAPGIPGTPGTPKKEGFDLGNLTLPRDDDLKEKVEAATDNIKKKDWGRATETLQNLVGRSEDVFIPVSRTDPEGREITSYVSVKQEAARIIGSLPKEGRNFYEATYGPKAAGMVQQARTNNDHKQMAQAVSLYFHTESGVEATNWLGTWMLDRGDFRSAARYFALLVNRGTLKELSDKLLLKAAYAFHHADDKTNKALVYKEMERRRLEMKLRADVLGAADLQTAINRMVASSASQNASDSPIYRGRPSRNAVGDGGVPFLEATWGHKLVNSAEAKKYLDQAAHQLQTRNAPIFSDFAPVTATVTRGEKQDPLILYRSYAGIHAIHLKPSKGSKLADNFEAGTQAWDSLSDWSLDRVLGAKGSEADQGKQNAYNSWLSWFIGNNIRPQIVFENSVLGSLSADSRYVYAIDDIGVPPPAYSVNDGRFIGGGVVPMPHSPKVGTAIRTNKLQAFALATDGKLDWELGGEEEKGELADTCFLGPPLPVGDRLYVLTEKQQELRLLCIDPVAKGKLVSLQTLANTKDTKLAQDPMRRTQAAHLAFGEGILVIPTNAGAVFGVDLLAGSLIWAYPYREKTAEPTPPATGPGGRPVAIGRGGIPPGMIMLPDGRLVKQVSMEAHWKVTAPIVQDGKVVFTAPDAKSIHCISLRDGLPVWTQSRRDEDLYLAGVFHGKVVIVGQTKTRALSLDKGNVLWELDTGKPSGQGAASPLKPGEISDIIYYLPIKESIRNREPEICAINVDRGIIHAHTQSRKKEVPGNLLFYEGDVISQTPWEIVAYPQLEVQLARLNERVKANPDDPATLTERGDYLLDKGEVGDAIVDFRRALNNRPNAATKAKARSKLYEALTDYFQNNFSKAEEFLKEYEELCKVDLEGTAGTERAALMAEERRRRANFLCLVGKGREKQNRLVEAFEKYLELGEESQKDELIQVVDEPSVKAAPDVWSQGRIAAMVADAKDPRTKKELEDLITARWKKLQGTKEPALNDLKKFVALFGSLFGVGKEARLVLAERLMEDPDLNSILEAEQHLSLLRGDASPEIAARALEALARLNTRKGYLEDAAYYYRLLGQQYPKVVVGDGKTGSDYLDDLATDKRFLPWLDSPTGFSLGGRNRMKATDEKSGSGSNQDFEFCQSGDPLPFFARHRLSLRLGTHQLRMTEGGSSDEHVRWTLPLTRTQFQPIVMNNGQPQQVKFSYQNLGHLVVLQLGHMVFGIDPLNKGRVLWEKNLASIPGVAGAPPMFNQPPTIDPRDHSVVVVYPDGWMQRLGEAGPLRGGVVCLQMRDQLMAIHPVTGQTLWTRSDVNSRTHVFGDAEHIYVVGIGENGTAIGSRVFRAYDGVSVQVPDFSNHYDKRQRVFGGNILASQTDAKGTVELRIYDVMQGKDVWRQKFAPKSLVLRSEEPNLTGVVEPNGAVKLIDLETRKEVLQAQLDSAEHLKDALSVTLLADKDDFFLAINGPADPNVIPWGGGVQSTLLAGTGLRGVPVNGAFYCFSRTGERRWYTEPSETRNQMLVVSRFADLPVVIFTSRSMEWRGALPARTNVTLSTCRAWDKKYGKWIYSNDTLPPNMFFHQLDVDPRAGKVDFTGQQLKVTFSVAVIDR